MKLITEKAELFFDLMWSLQFFINTELKILTKIKNRKEYAALPQKDKQVVREKIYEQPELIDKYIASNPDRLNDNHLSIIKQWKNFIKGDFYIERYLKNHAIFVGDNNVYGVLGLHDAFDHLFPSNYLPIYVKTILLPFQGRIVYDGLMQVYQVSFGGGIKRSLSETYMQAKQNNKIITTLEKTRVKIESKAFVEVEQENIWTNEIEQLKSLSKKLKGGDGQPAINSPVFSLVKASIALADKALFDPSDIDALTKELQKVERAVRKVENTLDRML
ncbi:hypothetical protein [Pseudanabaena yagii]|uniref:Uncharacterized protein n=1 Tax=Pseudanabaena yagii GIHE-NHR1 TaxID=2722753 RepID=A0ABX1LSS5_9CYAN|nr:hypothetical protein [Pseudanabaena yagii]NMF59179.1 hypothetical protein [Pseudanabaena yagii GIHE-NHR1]